MSNTSKVLITLVSGLCTGAILGILLAPDKGSETRRKMSDAAEKFSSKIKSKAKKMADGIKREAVNEREEILS